jgi:hypothetical protein
MDHPFQYGKDLLELKVPGTNPTPGPECKGSDFTPLYAAPFRFSFLHDVVKFNFKGFRILVGQR